MKKLIIFLIMFVFSVSPLLAATNDFTADGNITISGVVGDVTADMLIINTSTASSWSFNSGTFTVTDPGTFRVGSSNAGVISIKFTDGVATTLACAENTTPGTSYATAPTAAGTYTIVPSTTANCTSLCTALSHAATYNSFPTCGAATCDSGYEVSGSGANAVCVASACPTLSNAATYNASPTCGAATCNSGYSLSGTGASATCISSGGAIPLSILQQINDTNKPKTPTPTAPENASDSTQPEIIPTPTTVKIEYNLEEIKTEAKIIDSFSTDKIAEEANDVKNNAKEESYKKLAEDKIIQSASIKPDDKKEIIDFIAYGTKSTKKIGPGERAGTVNSFKNAFNKLPKTEADWNDVIKIANGRWPEQKSKSAEDKASINFKIVYKRKPDMKNKKDETAITIMAYGLRPAKRNPANEKQAINTFKKIYKYSPEKASAWDVIRSIAYSGATR